MPSWLKACFQGCYTAPYGADANTHRQATAKSTAPATAEVAVHHESPAPPAAQDLSQLGDVMRTCSGIPGSSYNQLNRICAILAEHFKVAYVSASVLSSTRITCMPVAAGGRLARLCPLGMPQFLDASEASSLYQVANAQRFLCRRAPGDELPPDWGLLRVAGGLGAFLAAAITVGAETVAILTMADEDLDKFASPMWRTSLELVGAFMGHLFRDRQLAGFCSVVEELLSVDSLDDLIRTLSRSVVRVHAEKFHQMRLTCRIACVASDASSAIIFDEALAYTPVMASGMADDVSGSAPPTAVAAAGPGAAAAGPQGGASHLTAKQALFPATSSVQDGHAGSTGSGGEPQAGAHSHIASAHTPRQRLTRLSLVYPSAAGDLAMSLQYQVQMHSVANLVPDPVDPGSPALPPAPSLPPPPTTAGPQHTSAVLPTPSMLAAAGRLHSAAGALGISGNIGGGAGVLGSGEGGMAGKPPVLRGVGTSISQPGLFGGGGGGIIMGDPGREAGLWDPEAPSNFSQQQLQVEGQTYLVDNTLLAEAIANRAGVWIGDCVSFMQNPRNPNADVFLAATAHHTTAMMLAVMWERSGGTSAAAAAGATGGSGLRPSACRMSAAQQAAGAARRPSARLVSGTLYHQVSRLPSTGDATSPLLSQSVTGMGVLPDKDSPQLPLAMPTGRASAGGARGSGCGRRASAGSRRASAGGLYGGSGGGGGHTGPVAQLRNSGDVVAGPVPQSPSPPAFKVGPSNCASPSVRGAEQPLLAFYLLTSVPATPPVLEELLVNLRELLVVLEPLVSSKLSDDLAEEWLQLQREVLDKSKVTKQPKDRTIVLRNTAAQLGNVLTSVDDASGFVCDPLRPPSARVPQLSRYTSGGISCTPGAVGAGAGAGAPAAAAATPATPAATTGGGGGGGGGGGEAPTRPPVSALRSMSERVMALGGVGHSPGGAGAGLAGVARMRTPSMLLMSRSFTGKRISALISGVQDRVQQAQRLSVSYNTMVNRPDDLRSITIVEKLGSGGFGTVYLGQYQSTEVAVKVIMERDSEKEVLRNAVELAVLSTLSHPNIVQVLTFFTDVTVQIPPIQARLSGAAPPICLSPHEPSTMQLDLIPLASVPLDPAVSPPEGLSVGGSKDCSAASEAGRAGGGNAAAAAIPEGGAMGPIAMAAGPLRQAASPIPVPAAAAAAQKQPNGGQQPKKALVILMEFCDEGCLADAIRNGVFKERVKGGFGALQPCWSAIYLTLLEVAQALRYLHSLNLVHRDLKPQNVLLKSSPSDVRGFTAKLSDFGLVKLLTNADIVATAAGAAGGAPRRRRYSGTITHVAPEAMPRESRAGAGGGASLVDVAVDIYAFGIVMWEMLTGQPVYMGLNSDQIIERVQNEGLRPAFPPDTPAEYSNLANRCLDLDPRRRPSSEELVQLMSSLSSASRSGSKVMVGRRRGSTLSNKELLRNVANANLAAANAAAVAAGAAKQRYNEDDFPLHIL